jgi:hypothetical protein
MKLFSTKRRKVAVVSVSVALIAGLSGLAAAFFTSSGGGAGNVPVGTSSNVVIHQAGDTIYDSTLSPTPDNVPSLGYEATSVYQLGAEITPASTTAPLSTVVVDLSSWACQTGSWQSDCTTTAGSTFPATITFNLYNPTTLAGNANAAPEYTDTQTFNIPYRPTSDSGTNCSGDNTAWYDPSTGQCYHGLETPVTFNFASQDIVLSGPVVYGIEYSTSDYGPNATPGKNETQPINSLNVALDTEPTDVSVGSDTNPGNVFASGTPGGGDWAPGEITGQTGTAGFASYSTATDGNDGLGSTNNIPAVQFNTSGSGLAPLYPNGSADNINLTITNTGTSPADVNQVTVAVASNGTDIESTPGDANSVVTGCQAVWFQVNGSPFNVNQTIPAGGSITETGQVSVQLNDSGTNQDACEGANVGLVFTSN